MSNETPTQLQGLILTRIWDIGSKQEAATANRILAELLESGKLNRSRVYGHWAYKLSII